MRCCSILRFCLRQATPRRKPRPLCCASWFVCRPAHAPFTKNGQRARVSLGSNQITRTVTASELPPPRYCAQALHCASVHTFTVHNCAGRQLVPLLPAPAPKCVRTPIRMRQGTAVLARPRASARSTAHLHRHAPAPKCVRTPIMRANTAWN